MNKNGVIPTSQNFEEIMRILKKCRKMQGKWKKLGNFHRKISKKIIRIFSRCFTENQNFSTI